MTCVVPKRRSKADPDREQLRERRREMIGARIRELRLAAGLTQEGLSLEAGLSRDHLIQVEHGRKGIVVERLYDIASALDIPVREFLPDEKGR